ncbi:MAG TPA: HAD-IA family hydrolase [Ilumatobacteraceae bacterium]|nr:HAD-IA family hydrolase [Ilumatobacteraceae bacterium]
MAIRGVLFDFGYTLFAHESLAMTIARCARALGATITDRQAVVLATRIDVAAMTPEEIQHPRDLDPAVWTERWKTLYTIADEVEPGLGETVQLSMHDPLAWVPYRDTVSTLRALSDDGVRVGVISNTGWDVRTVFDAHDVSKFVWSFTLSYEAGMVKPDSRIFTMACESIGVGTDQVVVVGDDPRSDGGAVAAGMRTLLLPPVLPGADNGIACAHRLVTTA